ncbi:NB-ARC domain-containing protein [Pseudoalteromonas sp.]|uniref:NB-ARC domain-containing protein n=1 Tax=Pseudoalteromonas sp. TaxID=53249 RepID=UPI003515F43E
MKQELRNAYVARLATEMADVLTGARFEQFGYIIVDQFFGDYELNHRGTNLAGAPVGRVVDTFSTCGKIVCEYSTNENYFVNTSKIDKDTQHAMEHYPQSLESLLLLSNRLCNPQQQRTITHYISEIEDEVNVNISVWDARKISEYIVDELLFDEEVTERLAHFLPYIQTIRNESAINLTIPKLETSYQPRHEVEDELCEKLFSGKSAIVVGFGGTGKSQLAISIANSAREEFDVCLWLDASELQDLSELGGYDVFRNGHRLNIIGLLETKKVLLVLDDIGAPVSKAQLESICKNGSAILATRRNMIDSNDWALPLLNRELSKNILEHNVDTPCPEDLFIKIYEIVGGYPLIYALMNTNILYEGYSWSDIDSDCDAISEYEDNKNQLLAQRLIGHLLGSLGTQLSFIKACGTKVIDLEFARSSLKPIGLRKLIKSTIVTQSNLGTLKIHDVIFEALNSIDINHTDISIMLQSYLEDTEAKNWPSFLRVSHRHNRLIYELYKSTHISIFLYSHLIACVPATLKREEIISPVEQFGSIKNSLPSIDRIQVSTLIETIENLYLLDKETSTQFAIEKLAPMQPIFEELVDLVANEPALIKLVKHHYAKCLLRLKQEPEAEAEFIALNKDFPLMYEVKLQLARIYARTEQADKAKELIIKILDAWHSDSGPSISVALASFELISRSSMREYKKQLNNEYSDLIASIIKEAMSFGYDHSYRAFSIFSGDWAYNCPEKFLDIFNYISLPQLSSINDNYTKSSIGDLYREAGKIALRAGDDKAQAYLELAIAFYEAETKPSAFNLRRLAESYCLKGDYSTSGSICLSLLEENDKDPFVYFWLSKALIGQGKHSEALTNIDIGLKKLDKFPESFKASFLEIKSDIHRELGRTDFIDFLRQATDLTNSQKYKLQLEEKIKVFTSNERSIHE